MKKSSIVVFYLDPSAGEIGFIDAEGNTGKALTMCNELRAKGMKHVTISAEQEGCVSLPGVDSVVDGKTPDGVPYTWVKRRKVY